MSSTEDDGRAAQELSALFLGTRADGTPSFTKDELLHFLPLVFLRAAQSAAAPRLSKPVERFLAEFATKLEVGPETPAEEIQRRIAAHYAAHPVNPALARAFERVLREHTALHGSEGASRRLAEFLGEQLSNEGYRPDAPRPEGSLRAGPLARFQAPGTLGKGRRPPKA